ncbi:MAG TPA: Hpt domain-containing protein [Planctomycetaceae bacterium]|nr:Hpt domain-containing protein [Planctomycetaceae bacterium]
MSLLPEHAPVAFEPWELLGRCLGKPELAARVLQKFERQLADDLVKLEHAIGTGDSTTAGSLAHRIKGAAANVAAHGVCEQAGLLETVLRMHMHDQLASTWQGLLAERDRFITAARTTNLHSQQPAV